MKVLVYGTLKKGFGNHYLLKQGAARFLGTFVTPAKYTMLNLGAFPGVILEGKTPIHGEVYEVSEDCFKRLDRLEGYPHFYNRVQLNTDYGQAWMYHLNNPNEYHTGAVVDGVWK